MSQRTRNISLAVVSVLMLLVIARMFFSADIRRQTVARDVAMYEAWLSNRFQRVQPLQGKVLLAPAPFPPRAPDLNGNIPIPIELYFLSPQDGVLSPLDKFEDYWQKPRLVAPEFKFGLFDGAKLHKCQIIDVQPDGIIVTYDYGGGRPSALNAILKLRWK